MTEVVIPTSIRQPVDAEARSRALDIRRSFAVSAPAGSGKTGLLTQRVLKLLASCQQPEEVLAITFTRKAAGEMRERLIEALHKARNSERPDNPHDAITWDLANQLLHRDTEQNWQLLQMPQRLRIQTIDGLCRSLASQLPIESGLGAPGEPLEQTQIAFEMAVVNLLKHLDGETPDGDLQQLLLHLDNDLGQLNKLLQILLEKREQWLGPLLSVGHEGAQDYFHFAIDELVAENLADLASALRGYAGELIELARYAGKNLQRDNPGHPLCSCAELDALPEADNSALPAWLALTELLVTGKGDIRKAVDKRVGFPAVDKKDPETALANEYKARIKDLLAELSENRTLLDTINEVRKLPSGLQEDQWLLLQGLAQVLPKLVAELKLVFQQLGATDYTEVAQAALIALGSSDEPTDLALKLDVQTRHILVDEFQDTSQIQLQLLEKLTAGWEPNDGRTLFIVGDGMQSCYGFRNANVGIFLDARSRGIGEVPLEALDLQVNFRSEGAVVDWVNRTFLRAFPAEDNISRGAVRYLSSHAFKDTKWPAPAVNFYGCIDDNARSREAQQVVELVRDLQARDPGGRIAILVRKKKHLGRVLPALSAAGLSYQAPDLAPLASKMVVLDLLSLTRALLDPSDRISWLALLRAPWCGLQLPDLYTLANWGNGDLAPTDPGARPLLWALQEIADIQLLSDDGRARLQRAAGPILRAWQQRGRKPLRAWIEGLWLALGGPAAVTQKSDLDNVQDFFQLLERFDSGGTIADWQQFYNALEKLFARPGQDASVQVMTIHKSKGLEFEHVLIPGLDQGGKPGGDQLLRWAEWLNRDGDSRFLLAPKSARGDSDPLFDYLRYDNSERERLEGTRLLYVGCTRAIRSLHLLACVARDEKKGDLKAPGAAALLASIWPTLRADEASDCCHWLEAVEGEDPVQSAAGNRDYLLRLPQQWQVPTIPKQDWLVQYRMPDYLPTETDEANIPELGQVAFRWLRHAGTVAHETLAAIAESDLHDWNYERVQQQRPLWQLRLGQLGLYGSSLEKAKTKVEQAVLNAINCDSGRWLLDSSHSESACELELHSGGRQLRRSIVDRTFIDADGARWIVDYKTAEPAAEEDPDDFIATQLERYRGQLEAYRKLFYARGERNIRCALYFPLLQKLAELN
ncbi:ATP-dependent exoDNAse (exonuclease V) beta subunit (contains helicase and exonuclease domains) [Microbulbifer donghaiensis]|uniref:DNA 3'-5' helicase n=1 Tax=Microbulbifer donghaiensis TaxID=494016 RepID=A0A1M4VCJ3_9GAMM|nr:UvrD-helicase domain-containing protein [Microbulbifer donghaiensis]SHE66669.1 ATP-dependent exoDNAse (exonuclease V) beta subunit (contains helicase and exonuclease domains) [Microbulbifer donghaiensis]